MALAPLARRGFLGRLAALPILGAGGASIFARRADAAAGAIMRQINEAERRCTLARQAFDEAHAAFEAALPRLHWTLDMTPRAHKPADGTHRRRHLHKHKVLSKMECGFDGEPAKRYVNCLGYPDRRFVATVETLTIDLEEMPFGVRAKAIRRMMRRARKRQAAIAAAEECFRLRELQRAVDAARYDLANLCKAIFEQPATTLPAIKVQARALCAYTKAHATHDGGPRAGFYGMQVAASLDRLAA